MKRLNIKLAVSLVIAFLVIGISVHVLHGVQTDRNAGGLLDQAREAYDGGDYKEAINKAERYLKHRVDDPEGQTLLANAAHAMAKPTEATPRQKRYAYGVMEKAVRVSPEDYDLRRTLLQYLYDNYAFRDALDHAKLLQAAGRGDADVELIVANSYARMGEFDKAIATCEKLTGYDVATREFDSSKATGPNEVEAYALLAVLLDQKNGDEEAATQVIEQLVAANDQSHEAQLESFKYWRQKGKLDKAREALDKAYELAPDAADVLVFRFELAALDKDYDAGEKLLIAGLEKYPKDERMYRGLAAVAVRRKQVPEAKKIVEQGLEQLPESHELLALLFDFQLQLRDTKQRQENDRPIATSRFPSCAARTLRGAAPDGRAELRRGDSQVRDCRAPSYSNRPSTSRDWKSCWRGAREPSVNIAKNRISSKPSLRVKATRLESSVSPVLICVLARSMRPQSCSKKSHPSSAIRSSTSPKFGVN